MNAYDHFFDGSMVNNLSAMQETQVRSPGQEESLEKRMATHSSILAWRVPWTGESGRVRVRVRVSPWGYKEWVRLSDFHFDTIIYYR